MREQEHSISNDPAELARRIQGGDPEAEGELFRCYQRGITILLRQRVHDRGEVEDLLQETFYLALRKIRGGELRDPERLKAFLCSLARNLAIDYHRKGMRRQTEPDSERLEWEPARTASQYDRVERGERAEAVRQLLAELGNVRDRELLFRFYLAEEDKREICQALGLSSLHFNRVLFRAKQRFRKLIEERSHESQLH